MNKTILDHYLNEYVNFVNEPENFRKLTEMKKLLSNIEKIETGQTEYEVIKETGLFDYYIINHLKNVFTNTRCS